MPACAGCEKPITVRRFCPGCQKRQSRARLATGVNAVEQSEAEWARRIAAAKARFPSLAFGEAEIAAWWLECDCSDCQATRS